MTNDLSAKKPSAWSALNNRFFRSLWIANVVSGIGSTLHDTAAVWTMASLTSSATLVTLMQTMSSLPLFLLALPAGALADIVDRRKVIIAAQVVSFFTAVALVALSWSGLLNPGILLTVTFILGVGAAFTMPTWQALLAEIVEKKDRTGALTLGSIGVNISRALGPMIAGVLLAISGPTFAFLLNAVSFLAIIFVLWRAKGTPVTSTANRERMLGAMAASLRFTRHSPVVQAVMIRNAMFAFFGIAPIALLPLIVRSRHLSAADFGALMSAYGIGGILAAFFLLPKLRQRFSPNQIICGATFLFASLTGILSTLQQPILMGIVLFIAGAAWLSSMSTLAVAAQSAFPNWVRARSSAIHLISLQASLAIGALVWGQVTAHSNAQLALLIAAGGLLATLLFARLFPINAAMEMDLTPVSYGSGHQLDHEPGLDDGPVMVALEYEVNPDDAGRFSEAMAKLRTIRLRDGAFRWALSQDLAKPTRFRESFHIGSWAEHLRQHERSTADDIKIKDAVNRFHVGESPPQLEHFLVKHVLTGVKSTPNGRPS